MDGCARHRTRSLQHGIALRTSRNAWRPLGQQDPELGDDTFLLVGRMLAYSPRLVMAPAPLAALLDTAAAGLLVQHKCDCDISDMLLSRSVLSLKAPAEGISFFLRRIKQSVWVSFCPQYLQCMSCFARRRQLHIADSF